MCACCLSVIVHISTMLFKSFLQGLARLANVLFGAPGHPAGDGIADVGCVAIHVLFGSPGHPAGDGIADVGCVAIHGCGQVHLVVGGSGLKSWSSLNIGANQAIFFSTFFHPLLKSSRSRRGG